MLIIIEVSSNVINAKINIYAVDFERELLYFRIKIGVMITKELLIKNIEIFPDEFSIDELVDRLVFLEKLEERIKMSDNKETISSGAMEEEIQTWFK